MPVAEQEFQQPMYMREIPNISNQLIIEWVALKLSIAVIDWNVDSRASTWQHSISVASWLLQRRAFHPSPSVRIQTGALFEITMCQSQGSTDASSLYSSPMVIMDADFPGSEQSFTERSIQVEIICICLNRQMFVLNWINPQKVLLCLWLKRSPFHYKPLCLNQFLVYNKPFLGDFIMTKGEFQQPLSWMCSRLQGNQYL